MLRSPEMATRWNSTSLHLPDVGVTIMMSSDKTTREIQEERTVIEEGDASAVVFGGHVEGSREVEVNHGVIWRRRPVRQRVLIRYTKHRNDLGLHHASRKEVAQGSAQAVEDQDVGGAAYVDQLICVEHGCIDPRHEVIGSCPILPIYLDVKLLGNETGTMCTSAA